MAAQVPDAPEAPTTRILEDQVVVEWNPTSTGGSPITGYKVYVMTSDGVAYNSDNTYCYYSIYQDTVLVNTACQVAIASLMQAPFSHEWGASITAKIIATNVYGDSSYSNEGNGAVITTFADAPHSLVEVLIDRSATTLGFSWSEDGNEDGGATVLDYTVSYDQGSAGEYVVLDSNVMSTAYTATDLTPGTVYKFKVQARNSHGLSTFSTELSLLCAYIPDQPLAPVSSVIADNVQISWTAPDQNGSPLTAYRILIQQQDG